MSVSSPKPPSAELDRPDPGIDDALVAVEGLREACHDIRQSIAGVLALAGASLAQPAGGDTRRRLQQIIGLAEWQAEVIQSVVDGDPRDTRPADGGTDVVRVVNEAAAAERLTWPGDLTLVWPPTPVFARLPHVVLRRIVANLLANATRAAGPAGTVTVTLSRLSSRMLLTVEDDGPGFGQLVQRHGLGLFVATRHAVLNGGRLECGRSSLGGARVNLWLPLEHAHTGGRASDAHCPV